MSRSISELLLVFLISFLAFGCSPASRPLAPNASKSPAPAATTYPVANEALFYNLPEATLATATGLYASPNRSELITPAEIPAGQKIYVMGRNATGSHLRAVWNISVGWIPVSFTDYNGQRDKLDQLPVFTREPPKCVEPILPAQFSLNAKWRSDRRQRIAVVVDIFRSKYGDFPAAFLSLTLNSKQVESSKRKIVENGQFSLKDVVFSLPGYVQDGDELGYQLETTSNEPLSFVATIFRIPDGCRWDI